MTSPDWSAPVSPSDYLARALAHRILVDTQRAYEQFLGFAAEQRPELASKCLEEWRDNVYAACHEMNEGAASIIKEQAQQIARLYSIIPPAPSAVQQQAATAVNEFKDFQPAIICTTEEAAPEPIARHLTGCTCLECNIPF